MDFAQLLSMASNKQKVNEKELATSKKGISTTCSTKNLAAKKKVDEEKQKKLDAIRARVEAQFKPKNQEQKPKGDEEIMDFTITGLSENDIRRKKLSEAEKAKKQQEFMEKLKRLKDRPIGTEENEPVRVKGHKVAKEASASNEGRNGDDKQKSSSKSREKLKEEKSEPKSIKRHERDKSKEKSHKHHKEKHHSRSKESEEMPKSEHSTPVKPEWVSLKKEKPPAPATTVKKKAPPKGPPPLSFTQLLSMAQENKNKPVEAFDAKKQLASGEKTEKSAKKKLREPDRPMTQEEKERFYRMQTPEYQRWLKYGGPRPACVPSSVKRRSAGPKSREIIHNTSDEDTADDDDVTDAASSSQSGARHSSNLSQATAKLKHSGASKPGSERISGRCEKGISSNIMHKSHSGKPVREPKGKQPQAQVNNSTKGGVSDMKKKVEGLQKQTAVKSKPSKLEPQEKANPPAQNPWDRIYGQIKQQNPKKAKKRRADVIESDEEYDEDLDGFVVDEDDDNFIDDSEAQDYSKYISEIFGYDKRKYRDIDDDDTSDMETGFAEQMKEEIRSAKIGLLEDLEDIKMEEEMKKKKLLKKKIRLH